MEEEEASIKSYINNFTKNKIFFINQFICKKYMTEYGDIMLNFEVIEYRDLKWKLSEDGDLYYGTLMVH